MSGRSGRDVVVAGGGLLGRARGVDVADQQRARWRAVARPQLAAVTRRRPRRRAESARTRPRRPARRIPPVQVWWNPVFTSNGSMFFDHARPWSGRRVLHSSMLTCPKRRTGDRREEELAAETAGMGERTRRETRAVPAGRAVGRATASSVSGEEEPVAEAGNEDARDPRLSTPCRRRCRRRRRGAPAESEVSAEKTSLPPRRPAPADPTSPERSGSRARAAFPASVPSVTQRSSFRGRVEEEGMAVRRPGRRARLRPVAVRGRQIEPPRARRGPVGHPELGLRALQRAATGTPRGRPGAGHGSMAPAAPQIEHRTGGAAVPRVLHRVVGADGKSRPGRGARRPGRETIHGRAGIALEDPEGPLGRAVRADHLPGAQHAEVQPMPERLAVGLLNRVRLSWRARLEAEGPGRRPVGAPEPVGRPHPGEAVARDTGIGPVERRRARGRTGCRPRCRPSPTARAVPAPGEEEQRPRADRDQEGRTRQEMPQPLAQIAFTRTVPARLPSVCQSSRGAGPFRGQEEEQAASRPLRRCRRGSRTGRGRGPAPAARSPACRRSPTARRPRSRRSPRRRPVPLDRDRGRP